MALSPRARISLGMTAAAALLAGSACVDIVGADIARHVDRQEK